MTDNVLIPLPGLSLPYDFPRRVGFIALVAYGRDILAIRLVPGLTVGILLGALVIIVSWILTWVYVRWANNVYDPQVKALSADSSQ